MIRRIFLVTITFLVAIKLLLSLFGSFNMPQAQSRLQLYQSEIVLQASEYQTDSSLLVDKEKILGEDIYTNAQKQYEEALEETQNNQQLLEKQQELVEGELEQQNSLKQITKQLNDLETEIKIKIALLNAHQGEVNKAIEDWESLLQSEITPAKTQTLETLIGLWQETTAIPPNAEATIKDNLDGWFEYKALERLYQLQDSQATLAQLQADEQATAESAVIKLFLIAAIPFLGVITGIILLILLLIQWLRKGKEALLSPNSGYTWEVPWGGMIIWQVLIVGFFFFSQYILSWIFSFVPIDVNQLSIPNRALYVLISYLSMAVGGLFVLYFSIRSFRPLPENWFRFDWRDKWILWGVGGYLAAFPLVLLVSLVNQQLWQGQGGSNPLILLALESQNKLALFIFLMTAAVAAPLFEEIIFRGFLLASLTRYLPPWGAIVVSSLIFSVAHLSLSEVLPLTTLGIVLGFVYNRSQNLLSPILLHSLWNGGTLFSLFILGS